MSTSFLYQFIARSMLQRPWRTLLTLIGVALGVAVVGAIYLANLGSMGAFNESMRRLAGEGALQIRNESRPMNESDLRELEWLKVYGVITPLIEEVVWYQGKNGARELLRVSGIEPVSLAQTDNLNAVSKESNDPQGSFFEVIRKLARKNNALIPGSFAKRHGLSIDSEFAVVFRDRPIQVRVAGILEASGRGKVEVSPRILFDIASAQVLFGRISQDGQARFDHLELTPIKQGKSSELKAQIASRLPEGFSVISSEDEYAQVERLTRAFHFNLNCLASLALIVGLFLVHNTITTSTILRRHEIAILRSLGVSRHSVTALFIFEGVVYGLLGCSLGLLLAKWLAPTLIAGTKVTLSTFFISEAAIAAVNAVDLPIGLIAVALLVCAGLSALAAISPANLASRTGVVEVLRGDIPAGESLGSPFLRILFAMALTILAYLSAGLPPVWDLPLFGFITTLLLILAGALIARPVAEGIARLVARIGVGRLSNLVLLGSSQARAGMRRIAVAVGALAVSVAMMVAIAILIESFRSTIVVWIDQTLRADLFIRSLARTSPTTQVSLSPEIGAWLKTQPEIEAVSELATIQAKYKDTPIYLNVTELAVPMKYGALVWKVPPKGEGFALKTFISESMAIKENLNVGDSFEFRSLGSTHRRIVDGIFYDYSNTKGVIFIDSNEYARLNAPALEVTNIGVYLKPGKSAEVLAERLQDHFASKALLSIQTRHALKGDALKIFDSTFAITYTLEIIALIVAGIGVLVTQLTLFFERLKEFGILRSLGCSRPQIAVVLGTGGFITGLSSQIIGILLGFGISLVLIYVVNVQSFGWTIQFYLPWAFIFQLSLALLVIAALLGSLPIIWLKGRGVIEVLREE